MEDYGNISLDVPVLAPRFYCTLKGGNREVEVVCEEESFPAEYISHLNGILTVEMKEAELRAAQTRNYGYHPYSPNYENAMVGHLKGFAVEKHAEFIRSGALLQKLDGTWAWRGV